MIKKADIPDHIIDTTMRLAGERGWRDLSLAEIAAAAGLPLTEVYGHFAGKDAILAAYVERLNRAVLAADYDEDENARDRLFDALMRRFEAMQPQRRAVRAVLAESPRDPLALLAGGPRFLRGMALVLEAAGLSTTGLRGLARVQAMAAVYAYALRAWLADDSPDMAKTMAAVDTALARAETVARLCAGPRRARDRGEAPPPAPAPEAG